MIPSSEVMSRRHSKKQKRLQRRYNHDNIRVKPRRALTRVKKQLNMKQIDPNKLIELAKQLDPALSNPRQALIDALVIERALEILKSAAITEMVKPLVRPSELWEPEPSKPKPPKPPEPVDPALAPRIRAMANPNEIGKELKQYTQKNRLTVATVARKLGVGTASVYAWMNGKWKPSDETRDKILILLGRNPAHDTQEGIDERLS